MAKIEKINLGITWLFAVNCYELFIEQKLTSGMVGTAIDLAPLGKEAQDCCITAVDEKKTQKVRAAAMKRLKEIAHEQDKINAAAENS